MDQEFEMIMKIQSNIKIIMRIIKVPKLKMKKRYKCNYINMVLNNNSINSMI